MADALSRVPHTHANLQAISSVQPLWFQEVQNSYVDNSEAQKWLTALAV